jgi:hypothetical protein
MNKKPTIKDVEKHCNENGYYIGEYWFPYKIKQNKDE